MFLPALALSLAVCGPPAAGGGVTPDPVLEALWTSGIPYAEFLAGATRRVEMWRATEARAAVPDAIRTRVAALGGRWRLLAIAEDACSDSANSLPYLARLADGAPNLELRVVGSQAGRAFMEAHRTPDGRAATPTVLLLAPDGTLAGCWIERPAELQAWYVAHRAGLDDAEYLRQKLAWYVADAGRSILDEVTRMIDAAARNTGMICGEPLPGS